MNLLALGPLELWQGDQQHMLGSVKQRCVLAVLVHARGEPVAMDTLMERVWGDEPPRTAPDTLQTYLSRLRGHLREAVGPLVRLDRVPPRLYQLRMSDQNDLDLVRFQRFRTEAAVAAEQGRTDWAIGLLRTAENLWRGEPLTESSSEWAASVRTRLVEDHRHVREERIRLELELGRHADLIGELRELVAESPLAEGVVGSLMLALHRSGRHSEALELYRGTHTRLRELGMDPGADLRALHQRILEQDRALTEPRPSAVAVTSRSAPPPPPPAPADGPPVAVPAATPAVHLPPVPPVRNNLPRDTRDFTGRTRELKLLRDGLTGDGYALPLAVLHGMPGIGKTALAVHAAHRLADAYPAGQLYVDLHGFSGRRPVDPAEALAFLLHAAGATGELPDTLDGRAAEWREWTARNRVLVVLDNARDAAQVRPLLPGSAGCLALVTSRNRLSGLDGATSLLVDALPGREAAALFTRIAGTARTSRDPDALTLLVEACGRHPLATTLLAGRFRHRQIWDLRHLLERLAQSSDPLDELDEEVFVSAFRFSYAELAPRTRRLLRLLALHPGPDVTAAAAAALSGTGTGPGGIESVRRSIEELLDCHLLAEPVLGRYQLHDLTRAFALRMCTAEETESARGEAVGRLLGYYLTSAHRAHRLTHPRRRALEPEQPSVYAAEFGGDQEASAWLEAERANLLAAARTAAAEDPGHAALFPHALAPSLRIWGSWAVTNELYGAAVAALRSRGDPVLLAQTLVEAADVLAQTGHGEALSCAGEALTLFQDLDDPAGCADASLQASRAHLAAGHTGPSLRMVARALDLYRQRGDLHGEAACLNVEGAALHHEGRYDEALGRARLTLQMYEGTGDLLGQIRALNNIGEIHRLQGRIEHAHDHFERSRVLAQLHSGAQELAILDMNLGAVYQAMGDTPRALAGFRRALESHRGRGDALGEANALISMGAAHSENGDSGEALLHFTLAEEVARSIDSAYERTRALLGVADVHHAADRRDAAFEAYGQALDLAERTGSRPAAARALAGLARAALSLGRGDLAREYGGRAVGVYRSLGSEAEAESLWRLLLEETRRTGS
ncbi:BTAD domain-containing putative transcriptional regulator [Streptomyces sp. ME02-6991-2A]|uniref:AfsR/SARP family transcriptional regulator n=1 Tax=Streptomyces sp. ME02-6991-2A TaxID=3028677 RepID=UPI0029BA7B4C|nr:BTAD domain-containing putative transcriptional regulator [Streptomyces sp. ME02-6991-2A]MDX3376243.1 BTAD domain-containing putative transcriptional regulator [Streptomyces sp. ME02-6991-2A]